jgi:uncharacterized protein with GYD domain
MEYFRMAYYLFQGRYSTDAIKAMVDNPHDREAAARALVEAAGGKMHSFFFCFGHEDVMAILEFPDDAAMAACALVLGASGALAGGATTKLLTSSEAQAAMSKGQALKGSYTPATG